MNKPEKIPPKRIKAIINKYGCGEVVGLECIQPVSDWDAEWPHRAPHSEHYYVLEDTMTEPKTMTGLEALAYLNEKRGERWVESNDGFGYTLDTEGDIMVWGPSGLHFSGRRIGSFLDKTYTPCDDPSAPPKQVDDSYERDKEKLKDFYGTSGGYWALVEHFEKWYQRKDQP